MVKVFAKHNQKYSYTCSGYLALLPPGITVGLERAFYTVSESMKAVEICITAVGAGTPCPSTQSFKVTLSTTDGSAGI